MFDCTIPNNTLSRAELNYESGSVRNIHYGDILIKYGSVVDVQNDEIPFATGKSSDDFKGALLQDGDIIIADTAEDETTGKACEIGNSQGLDVVSGLHTMVCRPRNKMALGYLGYYLNSDAYHHQLLPLMQGIKVLSLSRTNVQKTMVCYPKSKAEQQLIADCFRNLDNLITLHQRNSADFVSRFFSDFTNTWEQRKLGDIVGIYDGVHQTPNYQNSGVMFLSVENIATLKSSKFISEEDFKRDYKVYPQENDILMTRIGDVGTTNVVTDNGLKAYYVSLALLKYKSTDPYFLSNAIQSDYVQKGLANRTLKTAIPMKINKDEIGKVSVMLPLSATEQQQIGKYFRSLDHLITLHQCEYI